MSDLSLEIARWIGKSGFIKDWDRCQREADGLLEYLRERGLSLAAPPPLDGLLAEIEKGAATADHPSVEDGPAFARGARWAAERMAALRDGGETTK